jgi:hypothetical protein
MYISIVPSEGIKRSESITKDRQTSRMLFASVTDMLIEYENAFRMLVKDDGVPGDLPSLLAKETPRATELSD